MRNTIIDNDKGWKSIVNNLKAIDDSYTKVGVQQGTIRKPDSGKSKTSDMLKIVAANELGTKPKGKHPGIPSRPAIRQAFDRGLPAINKFKVTLYKRMVYNGMSKKMALGLLGEFHTNQIKERITKLRTPANADSTKAKKGSDNPLIDKGQYRNSITHVEVMK